MFNVEFVHWVRKASIGELGWEKSGEERRWEGHYITEENWEIGLEVSLLPLIHYTQHRGTTPTRKSIQAFFLWEAKVSLINPWCPNVWDTWSHMRKCGVLGSCIIFMCIRVYLVERKKHKSPYRPYFMLNFLICYTIPEPHKIATCPLCWYSSSHVLCPFSFFGVSPCVVQGKKWATTKYGCFFLSFCSFVK